MDTYPHEDTQKNGEEGHSSGRVEGIETKLLEELHVFTRLQSRVFHDPRTYAIATLEQSTMPQLFNFISTNHEQY